MKNQELHEYNQQNSFKKQKIISTNDLNSNIPNFDSDTAQDSPSEETVKTAERQWRNAGRAEQRRKMKSPSKMRLWWIMLTTPIALFWVFLITINLSIISLNFLSVKIQIVFSEAFFKISEISPIGSLIFLIILLILAPFLLDIILKHTYNLAPLSLSQLEDKSPESVELLLQYSQQHRLPLPCLKLLPTSSPVALTYGNHPRNACIVISRGLLYQLTNEEIATVYATQLGHLINKDVIWMSAIVALLQIPYFFYTCSAKWANQWKIPVIKAFFRIFSTLFYGIYQIWRIPALWLSRQRIIDSDRSSVQLTHNPNALCRALLKITIGISQKIQQQGYTPPLLESFCFLLPVDPRQVISLGSLPADIAYESILNWECTNPYRHWLSLLDSHPLLGERLYFLGRSAQFWKLDTELNLTDYRRSWETKGKLWSKLIKSYQALPILSAGFLFALGFGVVLRCLFWLMGKISDYFEFKSLIWLDTSFPLLNAWVVWLFLVAIMIGIFLFSDRHPHIFAGVIFFKIIMNLVRDWSGGRFIWFDSIDPFFNACCLIVFSVSLILWLNRYFPHSKNTPVLADPSLADLLANPEAVPGQPQLIKISGILLGEPKTNHWLGQELILQTSTGLIKLEFIGLIGNLIPWSLYPKQLIKKPVTVQGWFRRGSLPVIEVDALKSLKGKMIHSGATHFFLILIVISTLWGTYLLKTN